MFQRRIRRFFRYELIKIAPAFVSLEHVAAVNDRFAFGVVGRTGRKVFVYVRPRSEHFDVELVGNDRALFVVNVLHILDFEEAPAKLADIEVYKPGALNVEPDLKIGVPVFFVPTRNPVGKILAFARVVVALCFGKKDNGVRKNGNDFDVGVLKPEVKAVHVERFGVTFVTDENADREVTVNGCLGGFGEVVTERVYGGDVASASVEKIAVFRTGR